MKNERAHRCEADDGEFAKRISPIIRGGQARLQAVSVLWRGRTGCREFPLVNVYISNVVFKVLICCSSVTQIPFYIRFN